MKATLLRFLALALLLAVFGCLFGCQSKEEAQKKCNELSANICDKMVSCSIMPDKDSCMKALGTGLDCSKAAGWEKDKYEPCMKEVKDLACDKISVTSLVPDSCKGSILVEK